MMVVELCGRCGHANDHIGKKCAHERCECPAGIRTDAFLNIQMAELIRGQQQMLVSLRSLFALTLEVNGLELDAEGKLVRKTGLFVPN